MSKCWYPKSALVCLSFLFAYVLYHQGYFDILPQYIDGYGYISMFIGGLLFSTGFTTAFAIGLFVEMAPAVHPLPAAIIAGLGAMIADLCLFRFVRLELTDELECFKRTRFARWVVALLQHEGLTERGRFILIWTLTGLVIASPLPDEIGLMMVSGLTNIRSRAFMVFSYTMNTVGILIMLLAARG